MTPEMMFLAVQMNCVMGLTTIVMAVSMRMRLMQMIGI